MKGERRVHLPIARRGAAYGRAFAEIYSHIRISTFGRKRRNTPTHAPIAPPAALRISLRRPRPGRSDAARAKIGLTAARSVTASLAEPADLFRPACEERDARRRRGLKITMANKMLIDAAHPEETRVVVIDGNRLEEFDFEAQSRKQLAGNIYMARVTRVEPSLQAAFVDYGGNRHGFLAFSEIHPDYYQIPAAERRALIDAEEAAVRRDSKDDEDSPRPAPRGETRAKTAPVPASSSRTGRDRPRKRWSRRPQKNRPAGPERVVNLETGGQARLYRFWEAETPPVAESLLEQSVTLEGGEEAQLYRLTGAQASKPSAEISADVPAETPDAAPAAQESLRADIETDAAIAVEDTAPVKTKAFKPAPKPARRKRLIAKVDLETGGVAKLYKEYAIRSQNAPKVVHAADAPYAEIEDSVDHMGGDDAAERPARRAPPKKYRIQDVIKRRQVLLVQVSKEERGNKGAAMTTYLSIAGRYCVLMPNTSRGGGVSRKITNAPDRKRLKDVMSELDPPRGVGLIVRTAGADRSREDIHRDYQYLVRQWEDVRSLTFKSNAPALIYEEGSLIKRAIRDLYSADIDGVHVQGEAGFEEARSYMRMISPDAVDQVQHYNEPIPLYSRYQVEAQLGAMFSPTVQLKSGGYIVIGITEALVAIDINSGRSTKEGGIEETALKTNLEAADEIARQLRLRDLAGLVVIDFIDMNESRNNRSVEKRLKEALKHDRARLQVGRISSFGLLEMSRQRLRSGMVESSTSQCPHCQGTGAIRSIDNLALSILRAVEEEGARGRSSAVTVRAPTQIVNFLFNHKRDHITGVETECAMRVFLEADPALQAPEYVIDREKLAARERDDEADSPAPIEADLAAPTGARAEKDAPPRQDEAPARQEDAPAKEERPRRDDQEDDSRRGGRNRRGGRKRKDESPSAMQVIDVQEESAAGTPMGGDKRSPSEPRGERQAETQEPREQRKNGSDTNRRRSNNRSRGRNGNGSDAHQVDPRLDPLFVKYRLIQYPDALDASMKRVFNTPFPAALATPAAVNEGQDVAVLEAPAEGLQVAESAQFDAPARPAPKAVIEQNAPEAEQLVSEPTVIEQVVVEQTAATPASEPQAPPKVTPPPPTPPKKTRRKGWWSA